jgi:hypothetical protein
VIPPPRVNLRLGGCLRGKLLGGIIGVATMALGVRIELAILVGNLV